MMMMMLAASLSPLSGFMERCSAPTNALRPTPMTASLLFPAYKDKSPRARFKASCTNKDAADDFLEGFSVLLPNIPWDARNTWSTFATYFFSLHVPLSFGGLSVVAYILNQPVLDSLTMAISTIILQTAECFGALMLLHYTAKPHYKVSSFLMGKIFSEKRSSMIAMSLGFGFLVILVFLGSFIADRVTGPKDVNNPILKEILLSSSDSKIACFFLYCFITPLLEETVYRGFLLTSLASMMKWWQAVVISAFVFSIAHFSGENSMQLFLIGCILGSVYCWSGNLASSIFIHSAYNAMILLVTILS